MGATNLHEDYLKAKRWYIKYIVYACFIKTMHVWIHISTESFLLCECLRFGFFILNVSTASNKQLWQPDSVSPTWSPHWHNSPLSPSVWPILPRRNGPDRRRERMRGARAEDCALPDIFWHLQQNCDGWLRRGLF